MHEMMCITQRVGNTVLQFAVRGIDGGGDLYSGFLGNLFGVLVFFFCSARKDLREFERESSVLSRALLCSLGVFP